MQNVYASPSALQIKRDDWDQVFMLGSVSKSAIRVAQVTATWFGGNNDPSDNGQTASGVATIDNPWLLGCALPARKTAATPLPFFDGLPWGTLVRVDRLDSQYSAWVPLVDNGPSDDNPAGSSIDLTLGAWAALGGIIVGGKPTRGSIPVSFSVFVGVDWWAWNTYRTDYRIPG